MNGELLGFEDLLGHRFSDRGLLDLALTHRSFVAEHEGSESNERLEFLGDAVLSMVVTDFIFRTYPELSEGSLAQLRSSVVNADVLARVAGTWQLGDALRLGRGEETTGGRAKRSILADAVEAVLGAVFIDAGLERARAVIMAHFAPLISLHGVAPGATDFKTRFQEVLARRGSRPLYEVTEIGPDHAKVFTARVLVGGEVFGVGQGRSKKQAEQAAAEAGMTMVAALERQELGAKLA